MLPFSADFINRFKWIGAKIRDGPEIKLIINGFRSESERLSSTSESGRRMSLTGCEMGAGWRKNKLKLSEAPKLICITDKANLN